jgi:hypothetical protein
MAWTKGKDMQGRLVWHIVTDTAWGMLLEARARAKRGELLDGINLGGSAGSFSHKYLIDDSNFRGDND